MWMVMMMTTTMLAAVLLLAATGKANANQQLVVFAGPHKTSETSVEEFFYSFARGDFPEMEKEKSLQGWSWPQVLGLGSPHKAYNNLITSDDPAVQEKLLQALVSHLETSSKGIIMGGPEFDRVGDTRWSDRDAIGAVKLVQETLEMEKEDVTIVLLYQHPRVEQWLGIISEEAAKREQSVDFSDHYEAFLCDPDTKDERWESIATAMNPFGLAESYSDAGFNVVMIDLDGVRKQGLDVEHVIGCDILGASCTDGWIDGLQSESFEANTEKDDLLTNAFVDLSQEDVIDMEKLFRLRDCYYSHVAQDPKISFAFQSAIFQSCPDDPSQIVSIEMENSDLLLNALQSQKGCSVHPISVDELISDEPIEVTLENIEKYTGSKTVENDANGSTSTVSEGTIVVEDSNASAPDAEESIKASQPTVNATADVERNSNYEEEAEPSWYLLVLLLGLICFGVGMLFWIGRSDRIRKAKYTRGEMDGIMPSIQEDPNRPLSEVM